MNESRNAWSKSHPAKRNASHKKWKTKNPGVVPAGARRRRALNPDRYRQQERIRYSARREEMASAAKQRRDRDRSAYNRMVQARRRSNPAIMKAIHGNRRARTAGGHITKTQIVAQLHSQGSRCYYCWCDVSASYTVDHFIALASGGAHDASNLVIACASCNRRKNKFDAFGFFRRIGVSVMPIRRTV